MISRLSALLFLGAGFAQDPEDVPARLAEQLRSEDLRERDEAAAGLKLLGRAAAGELEKAARDEDAEVRSRAQRLLKLIEVRALLTPNLLRAIPNADERLLGGKPHVWTELFLEALRRQGKIRRADLAALVPGALEAAAPHSEHDQICEVAADSNLRPATPTLFKQLWHNHSCSRGVARTALEALLARAGPAELDVFLRDKDDALRAEAVSLLALPGMNVERSRFVPLLKDPAPDVRSAAARALGRLRALESTRDLLALLRDENAGVRSAAAEALGTMGATEAIPELVGLLADNAARSAALSALATLKATAAMPAILELSRRPDFSIRLEASAALAKLGSMEAFPFLSQALRDSRVWVRWQAAEALGNLGTKETVSELAVSLYDQQISGASIPALKELGIKEGLPELRAILAGGSSNERIIVLTALRNLADPAAAPEMVPLLGDASPVIRSYAADVLGDSGGREAVPRLIELLGDEDERVRLSAVGAIGKLRAAEAAEAIVRLLKDDSLNVRACAIRAAAALDIKEAAGDLVKIFADDARDVRTSSLQALVSLRAREAVPAIAAALEDSSAEMRTAAIEALCRLGAADERPKILACSKDASPDVRLAVARALGCLGDAGDVGALVELLEDSAAAVRAAAAGSLERLGAPEALPRIAKLLEDDDPAVRACAAAFVGARAADFRPVFTGLLDDVSSAVRIAVASALCEGGSEDGVRALLEESAGMTALNARYRPEVWNRLRAKKMSADLWEGTTEEVLRLLAGEAGLAFELGGWAAGSREWLTKPCRVLNWNRRLTLLQALKELDSLCPASAEFVLEADRIRALPRGEALALWKGER